MKSIILATALVTINVIVRIACIVLPAPKPVPVNPNKVTEVNEWERMYD